MRFNLQQWSQLALAFAIGTSLSAGYVAIAAFDHEPPPVIVVEERCPDADLEPPTPMPTPTPHDPLGLTHQPPVYGLSEDEQKQLAQSCELRDDPPAPLTDDIAAALGLSDVEREAWGVAEARVFGRAAATRFIVLTQIDPSADPEQLRGLSVAEEQQRITEQAASTKRPEDVQLHRIMAEERAGLRRAPKDGDAKEQSAWARWERYRLSRGQQFADALAEDLGRIRVDELRRKFGGWPGDATIVSGCEAPPDLRDPLTTMTVSEGLDRPMVARIIKAHRDSVQTCYEQGLAEQPGLRGTVEVAFTIDPEGKVRNVERGPATDLDHPATEQCIHQSMVDWLFPHTRDDRFVQVTYPFHLSR